MPVYTITDSKTGKTLDVRGDSPPTQEEAAAIFDGQANSEPKPRPRTWTDTAVDALPAVGGAVGGALGGIGGTVFGLGVGGAPGAIGGATLGGGAGEAGKQLINRWRGAPAPASAGEAATDIGLQGGVQGALEGAGQAIMPALKAGGEAVYRGYLKPSLSRVDLPKAAQIVKNAIAEGLPITKGGLQRADNLIGELNAQVNDLLSQATGKTVDLAEIANRVRSWATRQFNRPGRDPADLQAALAVADRIDKHPSLPTKPGPTTTESVASKILDPSGQPVMTTVERAGKPEFQTTVSMPQANQVKQDLQEAVGNRFGVPGGATTTRTEKLASAVTRKAIEARVPEVAPLNARQSRLMDVAKAIERATGREANKSPLIGVNTLASAAVGGEAYSQSGNMASAAAKALALRIGLTPGVATRAAVVAAKMADKIPGTAVADLARVAVQAVSEAEQEP